MQVIRGDRLQWAAVDRFESRGFALSRMAGGAEADALFVADIRLDPGGLIGRHPAVGDQCVVVLAGDAEVVDGEGRSERVSAGDAVFWADGEWHETRTRGGLTAIVVEAPRLYPGVRPLGGG